jgi:serine/threonine protein kinase/formylglycine-generating enzyme required for sulfatase activity
MKPPEKLGDFRIAGELGRGGMGIVFEAEQVSLGRRVALKVLSPSFTENREAVERFKTEALAAARLQHRNIVPVYAVGEEAGLHYYAMELVEGRTLSSILDDARRSPDTVYRTTPPKTRTKTLLEPDEPGSAPSSIRSGENFLIWVCRLIAEVAEGLDFAHRHGVLHRDIKPGNIIVDERGTPMLLDFGLARIERGQKLTVTGDFLGTPAYMSREQILGKTALIGPRSDVYALGVTLYELLTLKLPYAVEAPGPEAGGGHQAIQLIRQVLATEPIAPRQVNRRIPKDLETILLTAMEHDVARRYASAADLAADLRRFLAFQPIHAKPATTWIRARKFAQRNPGPVIGASVGLVALLALAGTWIGSTLSLRAQIRNEYEVASRAAGGNDFAAAEAAMNRILARTPSDDVAQQLLRQYQERRRDHEEKEAAERADEENRERVDELFADAHAAVVEADRLLEQAGELEPRIQDEATSVFLRDIYRGELESVKRSSRRARSKAGERLMEAMSVPTLNQYRRQEAEQKAASIFFHLFRDAEAEGDSEIAQQASDLAVKWNRGRDPEIDRVVEGHGTLTVACSAPGATGHLFVYRDAPEGTPYQFRRVPIPVPDGLPHRVLGTALVLDWTDLKLGALDIPTHAEIEAALIEAPGDYDGAQGPTHPSAALSRDPTLFDRCRLSTLKLERAPIAMGSYLLLVKAPEHAPARLPFVVAREENVHLTIHLPLQRHVPEEFVYVPAGWSMVFGGPKTTYSLEARREWVNSFLMQRREVTLGEYIDFLSAIWSTSPTAVESHAPSTITDEPSWQSIPPNKTSFSHSSLDGPVTGISIVSAYEYCKWRSKETGKRVRLPTELEWDRAARGADGREFPWGKFLLPTFCLMEPSSVNKAVESRPWRRFLADVSPFGVLNLAGSVSEYCRPEDLAEIPDQNRAALRFFARGGNNTSTEASMCSAATRLVRVHTNVHRGVGFRLAMDLDP